MVIAIRHTPGADDPVRELSPQVSRLIVLAATVLFWACAGLMVLALA